MPHTSVAKATVHTLERGLTGVIKLVLTYEDPQHPELPCIACLAQAAWTALWREAPKMLSSDVETERQLAMYGVEQHMLPGGRTPNVAILQTGGTHPEGSEHQ